MQIASMDPKDTHELLMQPFIFDDKKTVSDLVEEVIRLRQTILDLESQNHKLTKVTTVLSWVAVTFALIQVLPIILGFLDK